MSSLQAKLQHKYAFRKRCEGYDKGICIRNMFRSGVDVPGMDAVFSGKRLFTGHHGRQRCFYIVGCVLCLLLIALTTLVQYRATFLATYVESGVRRIALAEQLRKIPLSFFGKKICPI